MADPLAHSRAGHATDEGVQGRCQGDHQALDEQAGTTTPGLTEDLRGVGGGGC